MATFSTKTALGLTPIVLPDSGGERSITVDIDFNDAQGTMSSGQAAVVARIPPGFQVTDWVLMLQDMDSNGTPALQYTLGVVAADLATLAETWQTAIQIGRTGGLVRAADVSHLGVSRTAERIVALVTTTAAATAAFTNKSGFLRLVLRSV